MHTLLAFAGLLHHDMRKSNFVLKSTSKSDVGGQGQRKSGQLCLVLARPDRQTADRVFSRNPDKIRTADRIETDRVRTDRHLTENPDRIQTADGHRTEFSGKSGQKRDTDRTRTVLSADVCFEEYKIYYCSISFLKF